MQSLYGFITPQCFYWWCTCATAIANYFWRHSLALAYQISRTSIPAGKKLRSYYHLVISWHFPAFFWKTMFSLWTVMPSQQPAFLHLKKILWYKFAHVNASLENYKVYSLAITDWPLPSRTLAMQAKQWKEREKWVGHIYGLSSRSLSIKLLCSHKLMTILSQDNETETLIIHYFHWAWWLVELLHIMWSCTRKIMNSRLYASVLWAISCINIHASECPVLEDGKISSLTWLNPDAAGFVKDDISLGSGSNAKDTSSPLAANFLAQMSYFQSAQNQTKQFQSVSLSSLSGLTVWAASS